MHRNQQYAAFRPELTAEQRERLVGAENRTSASAIPALTRKVCTAPST